MASSPTKLGLLQLDELRDIRPETPEWLYLYIKKFIGFSLPRQSICENHSTPFDYVCREFFDEQGQAWTQEERVKYPIIKDVIVWANRGGLKTLCAGILSLLDCKFKQGCEIRALGGSLEQSNKIYGYFVDMISKIAPDEVIDEPTKTQTQFKNGSVMEILTQSEKSVRGVHVPKIRCDEVDEFKDEVWKPVQMSTASMPGIKSSFEALSTMHKAFGRMVELIDTAEENGREVLKWCLWEVIEGCPDSRKCQDCKNVFSRDEAGQQHSFYDICKGKAKLIKEFRFPCITIDDAHSIFRRSIFEDYDAEMLCSRPTAGAGRFYKTYDDKVGGKHVIENFYSKDLPLYISCDGGFHHPAISIFQERDNGQVIMIDEYRPEEKSASDLVKGFWEYMAQNGYKTPSLAICDPAAPEVMSEFAQADKYGYKKITVRPANNEKPLGAATVRTYLGVDDHLEDTKLKICKKCEVTRREMRELHFPSVAATKEAAEWHVKKDDHGPDTIRYMLVALRKRVKPRIRVIG